MYYICIYIYYVLYMCVFSSEGFPHVFFPAIPWKTSVKAKMRDELMKKFAEDDRLEQVSEHKRRMKAPRDDGATGGASESNEKMGSSLGKTGNNMGFHWQIRNLWWFQQNWSADQLVFRWRNSVWDNVCFDFVTSTQIMVTSCYFSSSVLKTEYRVLVFLLWSSGEKKPILHFLCGHPITFSFRKEQWLKLTKRRSLQENQHMGNWKYFRLLAADRCWHPVAYRWPL